MNARTSAFGESMSVYEPTVKESDVSTENDERAYCIVCDEYRELSDYSLHVRAWDGRQVAKANICAECVEEVSDR